MVSCTGKAIDMTFDKRKLHDPSQHHDSCGMGFVADIGGNCSGLILQHALTSLANLAHRGGTDTATGISDGTGVLTQIPAKVFRREAARLGYRAEAAGDLAVGVFFLPGEQYPEEILRCRNVIESVIASAGLTLAGWRNVPVNPGVLNPRARATLPSIAHALVVRPQKMSRERFRQELYLARKEMERRLPAEGLRECYIPSLSSDTIVYKGLLTSRQLREFYLDLQNKEFETAYAVFHQRFSTNTFPNWFFAQPFRLLAHNGEINTLTGNQSWLRARESGLTSKAWTDPQRVLPLLQEGGSDSAHLDNTTEMLVRSGRDVLHSIAMLVPEAWENMSGMDQKLRDFYQYSACLSEPWDGPAALSFADRNIVGACLDRNGLRPARYKITSGGLIILASEVGTIELDDADVVEKGRLGPGQMIAVDVAAKRLLRNTDIKTRLAESKAYGDWLQNRLVPFKSLRAFKSDAKGGEAPADTSQLARMFDYSSEEVQFILTPMAEGNEPTGSLGDDTPLAILSSKPRLVYGYLKQRFAQVTNPAIDPLRERLVMSLSTYLGAKGNLLEETQESANLLKLDSPILSDSDFDQLISIPDSAFSTATLHAVFQAGAGPHELRRVLVNLCKQAENAIRQGSSILVLSDRNVDASNAPIPMLLAVGAVHHHLIKAGLRMRGSIVAKTGEARDMHQIAALIGYGASAVYPYLAYRMIREQAHGHGVKLDPGVAVNNYKESLEKQLLKVMAKMGISTVSAYSGAQLFDAIGLSDEVVEQCLTGTTSHLGGLDFSDIAQEVIDRHTLAFAKEEDASRLIDYGYYRFRRSGETHAFTPHLARTLHSALKGENGKDEYGRFVEEMASRGSIYLRDLLGYSPKAAPIPLDEVEPAKEIVKRLSGGSMSFGALSIEAHKAITQAFNRVGSKSGSGEGGEDPDRYSGESNSRIKQVASGRFGVTPAYLISAGVLEIKMAQGSKPGEGGQLPAHKVTKAIASVRLTPAGVPLISPPPHHDIYSIEDLAQLIYDLKMVNPAAKIMVKLVSETGVGTIAAGVAKAGADVILISGMEGGTGASPWASIKNTGMPWELGLAETHQVLVENDLRSSVVLRTDGGLRTGRDVVIAAALGAEEYGFGTAALVAVGCLVSRQCHLNTCPVGIASQDPELRKKFDGTSEMLVRYLFHVAEETREILSSLGVRSVRELVGRSDFLQQVRNPANPKANHLDLSRL
ncbi:MAG: glutamate synthase large subunit, partial [SAR202 cluster bacterium]|nr:glutamate synthase large subunit [SAR202 cluster bacterium]